MKLFVDLDGVLAHFEEGFPKIFGKPFNSIPEKEAWKLIADNPLFWAGLDPMEGSLVFFDKIKIYNPTILTGVPSTSFVSSAHAKKLWCKKWLGKNIPVIPCIRGVNKPAYMDAPGDILIDDMEKNVKAWEDNLGVAILHNGDYNLTQTKLWKVLNYG